MKQITINVIALFGGLLFCISTMPGALNAQENCKTNTEIKAAGKTLKLVGRGLREFLFIDIYKMGAYSQSGECEPKSIVYRDEVKAIRLSMVRKIPADRMNDNLRESLEKNLPANAPAELKGKIDTFLAQFKGDLASGTFIEIIYIPGKGTVAKRDGVKLGVTPGKDFAEILWKAYFGADTCCPKLKSQIMECCKSRG